MRVSRNRQLPGKRTLFALFALIGAIVLIASCSTESKYGDNVSGTGDLLGTIVPGITVANPSGTPIANNAVDHQPGEPVVVTAADGVLTEVSLPKSSGSGEVQGTLSDDGRTWTSTEPLGYGSAYELTARAVGAGGETTTTTNFRTTTPDNQTAVFLQPEDTYGIAQSVSVQFDEPILDRKAAQEAIKITSNPEVEGAFYWINDTTVRWRPEHFWEPGTEINVAVDIYGKDLGGGTYGQENAQTTLKIGRSMILTADDNTKQVVVEKDGQVIRTMPVSFGKDGTPTDRGTYMIGDRLDHIIMDSSTYGVAVGSPDGYRTPVDFATQMSYSGIYLHSAPWSVWAQGNTNTSHGCLNLSPDDALWTVRNTLRGDPVIVKNTNAGTLSAVDGLGDWNMSWSEWKRGNAGSDS